MHACQAAHEHLGQIARKSLAQDHHLVVLRQQEMLVEAHVAIAEEIARQAYNQKVDSLAQWVGRASGLAEDYISKDGGSVELRLFISQRVLSSLASFKPTLDQAPWVAEAEEAANLLAAQGLQGMASIYRHAAERKRLLLAKAGAA